MTADGAIAPLVLSPYLLPLVDGGLVIDNFATTVLERLSPVEAAIVRALWPTGDEIPHAADALLGVEGEHGRSAVVEAIARLRRACVLFPDRTSAELFLDTVLELSVQEVPFIDQIELTNRCPMKCQFCPRGIEGALHRPEGFMKLDLFRRVLAEMHKDQATYHPLELHHCGESLLHPEVDRFVEVARAHGLPTELSVNPSHLSPDLVERLLGAGISRLVLSLDGFDQETLAAIRGPAARFDRAERNIEHLLERVAAMSSPPRVVIQMIDLHRNRHQHAAFLARWTATGLPTVEAQIKNLDGDDPDLGHPTSTPNIYLCTYPWRSVVVLWDGRVVPCCKDADASLVLGHLERTSLRELWQSEEVKRLRQAHRAGSMGEDHVCHGCSWRRENFVREQPRLHPDRARHDPLRW